MTHIAILPLICLCLADVVLAQSPGMNKALDRLASFQTGQSLEALDATADAIRDLSTVGDDRTWAVLSRILDSPKAPWKVKERALDLAIEKADQRIAKEILGRAEAWARVISRTVSLAERKPRSELNATRGLVSRLLERTEADDRFGALFLPQDGVTEFLLSVSTEALIAPATGDRAVRLLHHPAVSADERKAFAEAFLTNRRGARGFDESTRRLFDPSMFPLLRRMVKQSDDPTTFHFGAASLLAHFGDTEVLEWLEQLSPRFHAHHRNVGMKFDVLVWKMKVQSSEQAMLDFLASDKFVAHSGRAWLVERLVELRVEKQRIRTALLKHAAVAKPQTIKIDDGRTFTLQPDFIGLKEIAILQGVLTPADWPDVPYRSPAQHLKP